MGEYGKFELESILLQLLTVDFANERRLNSAPKNALFLPSPRLPHKYVTRLALVAPFIRRISLKTTASSLCKPLMVRQIIPCCRAIGVNFQFRTIFCHLGITH